jgi:hypothetical protein
MVRLDGFLVYAWEAVEVYVQTGLLLILEEFPPDIGHKGKREKFGNDSGQQQGPSSGLVGKGLWKQNNPVQLSFALFSRLFPKLFLYLITYGNSSG